MMGKTLPHIPNIILTEQRFKQFTDKFFGPLLPRRLPKPDLGTVKSTYVQCWQEMVKYTHMQRATMTESMDAVEKMICYYKH